MQDTVMTFIAIVLDDELPPITRTALISARLIQVVSESRKAKNHSMRHHPTTVPHPQPLTRV